MKQSEAEKVWSKLEDIPIDKDEQIEIKFMDFEVGTHREDIWHWFEDYYDVSVASLMGLK